ncbi:hypothetical protein NDU88_002819, partial [Pleurodeles waltl]
QVSGIVFEFITLTNKATLCYLSYTVLVVGGEFVQLILVGKIMASRRMTAQQVVGMLFES